MDASGREQLSGLGDLGSDASTGDEDQILAAADHARPPENEIAVQPANCRSVVLADSVIDRAGQIPGASHCGPRLLRIGRGDHRQSGLGPHDAEVLEGVMGGASTSILEATAHANDAHREAMEDRTIANELKGPERGKGRNRVDKGDVAGLGEPGCDADHVLFRNADVEEAIGKAIDPWFNRHEAEVAGKKQDPAIALSKLDEGLNEGSPQAALVTSSSACRYSDSDIGR